MGLCKQPLWGCRLNASARGRVKSSFVDTKEGEQWRKLQGASGHSEQCSTGMAPPVAGLRCNLIGILVGKHGITSARSRNFGELEVRSAHRKRRMHVRAGGWRQGKALKSWLRAQRAPWPDWLHCCEWQVLSDSVKALIAQCGRTSELG